MFRSFQIIIRELCSLLKLYCSWVKRDQLDVTCFIFSLLKLNMFWTLIHPSSEACDLCAELFHGLHWSVRIEVFALTYLTDPWNNSAHKSQAPEDGCINVRNILSIKWRNNKASDFKLVSLCSTIKMMHGPINIRLYYSIHNSIRICKRGVVAAYHVVLWSSWLGVRRTTHT